MLRKTINVVNSKSYPLSMPFTFSLLPMRMEAQSNWINRTVADNRNDSSTNYHLVTSKFLVCSLSLLNRENTWVSRSFLPFQNSFPVPVHKLIFTSIFSWINVYLLSFSYMVTIRSFTRNVWRCKVNLR